MKEQFIEDLKEIKKIMSLTTRFISLSGLSGISTGIIGLLGVFIAFQLIFKEQYYLTFQAVNLNFNHLITLLLIGIGTLFLSLGAAVFFTIRKTKKQNQKNWNLQTKRLVTSLLIPLLTGGILCLIFLYKGFIGVLPPFTLIFYGLALVNSSKYTIPEIKNLGLIEIIIGLTAMLFIHYGLLFWALGFGIMHIIYGLIIQIKYKT
jgi:hypothetical protein